MNFGKLLGTILKEVAKKNFDNPKVKTADPVVFEDLQRKMETVQQDNTAVSSRGDLYKDYFEKIKEAQTENEANPNVETADKSVYEEMMAEIERLKTKVEHQERSHVEIPNTSSAPTANTSSVGVESQAMTNSMGGSLQIRTAPNMGADYLQVRIPEDSLINILEYSENSIMLDGRKSRFAKIEFNGQVGWVLESYLNFN